MGGIVGGIIKGVGSIIGAKKASKAAGKASDQLEDAGRESLAFQREIFETTEKNAKPFIESGELALEALLFELGLGPAPIVGGSLSPFGARAVGTPLEALLGRKRGGTPFAGFQESPGFKFAFQKGVDAVDASAAAGGSLFSGSTLEDLTKFGQGFAAQGRGTFLDRLQGLVNAGQVGVGQVSGAGSAFAAGGSQTIEGIGNAQAAGTIGKNNAFQQGLNGLTTSLGQITGGIAGIPGFPTLSF